MATEIQKSNLQNIQDVLLGKGALDIFKDALPEITEEEAVKAAKRFGKMVYVAVCQSPELQKCDVKSITKAASISASLDLDIDPRGYAYLVPFKNQAVFIIGYRGLMELAYRSRKVKSFVGEVIYESEVDKVKITRTDGRFEVIHPFSYEQPKGEIVAAYVTAEVEGYGCRTAVLRKDEIEFYRSKSACPNSPAWKGFYKAMAIKTCVRQLCKWLPLSVVEGLETAINKEESQHTTFVESQEIAQERNKQLSGSVTAENVFSQPQDNEPEGEEFLKDE